MAPTKKFRNYSPEQKYLLPPDIRDWLPSDDLVYFLIDVVSELDLSPFYSSYSGLKGGQPPYDPSMMVCLILYAYCIGMPSSRKIEQATYSQVPFRVLCSGSHPDHDTICSFRKRHLSALSNLFLEVLHLCREAGLVKLGHVSLDGSKVKANASKHKAMSYSRMLSEESRLKSEIAELLAEAERVDNEEDRRYGKGKRGNELPAELRRRESRLQKIREAKNKLESDAKEAARKKDKENIDKYNADKKSGKKNIRKPKPSNDKPPDKTQYNFTDPESRIMPSGSKKNFEQAYNCQAVVDSENQVIVASHVSQSSNDKKELKPAIEKLKKNLGDALPQKLSADSGYFSESNVKCLEGENIDGYIATGRLKHNDKVPLSPRGPIPKKATVKERMGRKLRTKKGRETYSARKYIVEPVFGQIKEARGIRSFSLRGFENVMQEWDVICLTHNLLKLFRSGFGRMATT